MKLLIPAFFAALSLAAAESGAPVGKFQQLDPTIPTPSAQRNASGAPGTAYWQNRADYDISVELDDVKRTITGKATVTYHNLSPDPLTYLWVQLDQNFLSHTADSRAVPNTKRGIDPGKITYSALDRLLAYEDYDGEMKITKLTDAKGNALPHAVVKTMLRLDMNEPLAAGTDFVFKISWSYPINDCERINARTGYEFFKEDGNTIYTIAQWFPRMAAYTDYAGWINKQFLGTGEFTLEFGNYTVRLTVPDDHLVAATGTLQNPDAVLTKTQRDRLKQAESATKKPLFIVTPDEAKAAEKSKPKGKKTWAFQADNVRDFAFASSRKFVWDAMAVEGANVNGKPVMAMSLYPKEGMPLWDKYSTHAIAHTIQVYSRYTFEYPYPVAWSVNGPIGGMEYPMICFNGPRPEKDGTYPEKTKYALIGVVIHEVGHNYFPMIVNSDERQWTWMDEGLNSFVEFLAEEEWENDWKHRRNERGMVDYMRLKDRVPVMTNSESIADLGPNAYGQPTVALNILREHILGREAFDHAFKTYAKRWMFKRPTPADFFRTMEEASGVDLDWFWRGWFYTNEHVDISLEKLTQYTIDTRNPEIEKPLSKKAKEEEPVTLSAQRNKPLRKRTDDYPELLDFYNKWDEFAPLPSEKNAFETYVKGLDEDERKLLDPSMNFYALDLKNIGGVLMPVILKVEFNDGTKEELRIPAEIWRRQSNSVTKLIPTRKEIRSITLDPHLETADADLSNNHWPRRTVKSKFQLFKEDRDNKRNPMNEGKSDAAPPPSRNN